MSLAHWREPPPADDPDHEAIGYTFQSGGTFVLDAPETPEAVWGQGEDVLWAAGEALLIAAPQGTGKTTIAQQIALGRCGFPEYGDVLGYPVQPGNKRTLYLAMDRPRQAARSMRRMVGAAWRSDLDDRLAVWHGPPPHDLAVHPHVLWRMAHDAGADTVVVDSVKDAAVGLSSDETGAGWNRARQTAIQNGIDVLELHHQRKKPDSEKRHPSIDDIYGSTWITSGCGSILLLDGKPGDPIVRLHHVKQPAAEVGPFQVIHDHEAGQSSIWHATDLVTLASRDGGLSAHAAAEAMFDTDKPTPGEKEKARRKLARLTEQGLLVKQSEGSKADNLPAVWGPA